MDYNYSIVIKINKNYPNSGAQKFISKITNFKNNFFSELQNYNIINHDNKFSNTISLLKYIKVIIL